MLPDQRQAVYDHEGVHGAVLKYDDPGAEPTVRKWLVTGGAGFIGHAFIRMVLEAVPDFRMIQFDLLASSGRRNNIEAFAACCRHQFVHANICDSAAESHADHSTADSRPFVGTSATGTQVALDAAQCHGVRRFLPVSTDEEYGNLGESGQFTETSPLLPISPYAASHATAEHVVRAAACPHALPALLTRAPNKYGFRQFPEKLIPVVIGTHWRTRPFL